MLCEDASALQVCTYLVNHGQTSSANSPPAPALCWARCVPFLLPDPAIHVLRHDCNSCEGILKNLSDFYDRASVLTKQLVNSTSSEGVPDMGCVQSRQAGPRFLHRTNLAPLKNKLRVLFLFTLSWTLHHLKSSERGAFAADSHGGCRMKGSVPLDEIFLTCSYLSTSSPPETGGAKGFPNRSYYRRPP